MPAPSRPKKLKRGPKGQLESYNQLRDYSVSNELLPGEEYEVMRGPDGTQLIFFHKPAGTVGGSAAVFDFTLTPAVVGSGDSAQPGVQLGFGNITGDGLPLDPGVNPWPQELLAGNTPPWTDTKIVSSSPWYAYVYVTASDAPSISEIHWNVFTAPQVDDGPGGTFYFLLGNGSIVSGKTTVANSTGKGSQKFAVCGESGYFSPSGPAAIP